LEALLEEVEARPVQALEEPPSAARRAVTALFFVNGMLLATWVSRIPAIEGLRGLNHAMFGLALLVVAAGAIVSMPIAGALSASIGTGRICQYSALTYCLVLPLLALIPSPAIWGLALFVFGAGHGALDVAMNAQAVAIEKRYHRPIMSSFHALFSIGGLTGAVTGGLLATLRMRPETHFCLIAAVLGVTVLATFPHLLRFAEPRIVSSKKSLTFRLPDRGLIALGVVALCTMMGEGAMADWSAVYLKQTMGTSEGLAAVGYGAFSIAMAAGRFTGDWLSAHFRPADLVRSGGLLAVMGMLLALFSQNAVLALVGFACVGAGFATIVPMVFSAAGRTPGIASGVAMATVTTMGYFGFLAGPPFIGITAEQVGLRCALGIIAATSLLIVILSPALRRDGSSAKGVLCLASRSHGPN
jgi:predicted MFS family arabinose efflux permease